MLSAFLGINNIIKSLAAHRTGNLDPNSTYAFGDDCEELTSKWRGIKRLAIEYDNFKLPFDHSRDPKLGIIQTKGARLSIINYREGWHTDLKNEYRKEFDYIIFYCVSRDGKIIERIYIFPKEVVRKSITILRNHLRNSNTLCSYEKYSVR